jgi:hypothetical protein
MYIRLYVMAIVVCLSALSASCALFRPGPAQVAEEYFELTKKKDAFAEQKKLFTKKLLEDLEKSRLAEDYKGRSFEADISGLPSTIQMFGGIKTIKIQKAATVGDGAEVHATIYLYKDNEEVEFFFELLKEGDEWEINSINYTQDGWHEQRKSRPTTRQMKERGA